jgi:hypothetical protein
MIRSFGRQHTLCVLRVLATAFKGKNVAAGRRTNSAKQQEGYRNVFICETAI